MVEDKPAEQKVDVPVIPEKPKISHLPYANFQELVNEELRRKKYPLIHPDDMYFCNVYVENGGDGVKAVRHIYKGMKFTKEQAEALVTMKLVRLAVRSYLGDLWKPIEEKIKLCANRSFARLMHIIEHGKNEQAIVKAAATVLNLAGYAETINVAEKPFVTPEEASNILEMINARRKEIRRVVNAEEKGMVDASPN